MDVFRKSTVLTKELTSKNIFLVPFFNSLYYFCYSPFKIQFDKDANKYVVKTRVVQQVLCAISQGAIFLFNAYYTFIALLDMLSSNDLSKKLGAAVTVFDVGSSAAFVGTLVFLIYSSWGRKRLILELVERTRVGRNYRIVGHLVQFCVIIMLCTLSVFNWVIIKEYSILEQGALEERFNSSDESGVLGDMYRINALNDNTFTSGGLLTIVKTIATNLWVAVFVYVTLYYTICQVLFMLLALTIKQLGNEFEGKLKSHGYDDEECGNDGFGQGTTLYKQLKYTTELIKNVFGNVMIGYYLSSVAYLAEAPHILLGNRGSHEKIVMVYSGFSVLIWVTAAEFHHQVQSSVLKWTDYHFSKDELCVDNRVKILSISNEVSSTETRCIAMGNKCFSVTYKHLSSMFGIIVTYGIIVFQLYNGQFQVTGNNGYEDTRS